MSLFFFIVEIPMSDERLYYIKEAIGDDKWLTYEQAHRYGCTHVKPSSITVYDANLQTVTFRVDPETNTFFDLRQDVPHDWLVSLDSLGLYRKLGNTTLYRSEVPTTYESYTSIVSSSTPTHVFIQGEGLVSIRYLYEHRGITQHTCKNFMIDKGVLLVWYDSVEDLYWDNHSDVMTWVSEMPVIEQEEANYIPEYPFEVIHTPQWEYDLSQMPQVYRSYGTFEPTHATVELVTVFKKWEQWDLESSPSIWTRNSKSQWDINWEPPVKYITLLGSEQFFSEGTVSELYTDTSKIGVPIYVAAAEGVDDIGGVHRDYGYAFTGDYEYVWVDSDADVPMYQGTTKFTIGQSHDEVNEVLYYINSLYYTPSVTHDMGYTFTAGEDIEVWDSNLIGKRLWEDTQWLYLTPSTTDPVNLPIIDGTLKYASAILKNNSYVLNIVAKEEGEAGNHLSVKVQYHEGLGWSYTIYRDGVQIYYEYSRNPENDYVTFSGDWPASLVPGPAITATLSGGTDVESFGVPLYYADGTRVAVNDYLGYDITQTLQSKSCYWGSFGGVETQINTFSINATDFSFVSYEDYLYLKYTGSQPISNILGFSFNWSTDGSIYKASIDVLLGLRADNSKNFYNVTWPANDWWYGGYFTQQDKTNATNWGLGTTSGDYRVGRYGAMTYSPDYSYRLISIYSDDGITQISPYDSMNYYLGRNETGYNYTAPGSILCHCILGNDISCKSYTVRVTGGGNKNNIFWASNDTGIVTVQADTWNRLYKANGLLVNYVSELPTILGYLTEPSSWAIYTDRNADITFRHNNGYLEYKVANADLTLQRLVMYWA